jgi:hypothetical protein
MDTIKLKDRSIFRKQPKMQPLRKVFITAASSAGSRKKRHQPSLPKMQFTNKQEKQNDHS